jgi:hypothetical protein
MHGLDRENNNHGKRDKHDPPGLFVAEKLGIQADDRRYAKHA